MIEMYLVLGLLAVVILWPTYSYFKSRSAKKVSSPYTRIRIRNGERQVYNSNTNEWILWSLIMSDLDNEQSEMIETKFESCNEDNMVGIDRLCISSTPTGSDSHFHDSFVSSSESSMGSSSYSSDSYSSGGFSSGGYSGSSDSGSSSSSSGGDW